MQYIPPTQTSISTNTQTMQASDAQRMSDQRINPTVKNVLLKLYLERVIRQNERAGVTTSVAVSDLQSGAVIEGHNIDTEQFAASLNKLPIARLVLNDIAAGKLQMSQTLTWSDSDVRPGAGVYDQAGAPKSATLKDLLYDMLNPSGNTAVRVFVNKALGGAPAVNTRFANELNLQHTYLQPLETPGTFYVGNTTARESTTNIQALLALQNPETAFVKNALATNIYTDYGVRSQLAGNDFITLANKVGILNDPEGNNRHDTGIIYNTKTGKSYVYSFMNTAQGTPEGAATSQAGVSLADMGRGTLRYAGDTAVKEKAFTDKRPFTELRIRF